MRAVFEGQTTTHEVRRTERKGERGVCRIKKRIGPDNYQTVGSGSLIKHEIDPIWRTKYFIVTTIEVFQDKEDFDIKNYRVDFVKSRSRFKTIQLHAAIVGDFILQNSSGLALIPLYSHSSFFGGLCRKKCGILKHRPFEVGSFDDENIRDDAFAKDLCCYMVADDASSTLFGVKPHEITRGDSTGQYVLSGLLARDVPLGAAILRWVDSKWRAVGVFSSTSDTSVPIWLSRENLSSKWANFMFFSEQTPEIDVVNDDQNSKEEPTNEPGSADGGTLCGSSAQLRISSQFKKEERKKEKEDMKKKDEHDWEKEEEERTNRELQDSKKKEEDRKRKEEQDRMNEEEDRKRNEEQDKKKEEEDKKMEQETDGSPGSLLQYSAILNVTLASDADGWNKAVNEQLLTKLAQDTRVKLVGFVPKCTPQQKEHARSLNIELVDANEISGYSPIELLAYPPDGLDIDILIIHAYGRDVGRQAQIIQKTKKCKWVHVVHTISEELEKFAEKSASSGAFQESEHELQTDLCERADLVVAIGPKVAEAYKSALRFCGKDKYVIDLTPAVPEEFLGVHRMDESAREKFRVLISGSTKYFKVKGCDIAAKAIKLVQDSSYLLFFVGQKNDSADQLTQALQEEGINLNQLIVRISRGNTKHWHQLLCGVDLLIKPSRTEGFGISGLRAISADLPVLVSGNCGLGMTLKKLHSGKQHVVESDNPQVWADKIKEVRAKNPKVRKLQSKELRNEYSSCFSWETQCDQLVEIMLRMVPAKSEGIKKCAEHAEESEHGKSLEPEIRSFEPERVVHEEDINFIKQGTQELGLADKDVSNAEMSGFDQVNSTNVPQALGYVPNKSSIEDQLKRNRLSTNVVDVPYTIISTICFKLNANGMLYRDYHLLGGKMGFSKDVTRDLECKVNPIYELLKMWSIKPEATVQNLIALLKDEDLETMDVATILEDWAERKGSK